MPAKRKPKPKKTARETPPASVMPEKIQRPEFNGGALYAGGVPGNSGGGRPPDEWKRLLSTMTTRSKTVAAMVRILKNPDHPHFANVLKWINARSYPELEPVIIAAKLRAAGSAPPPPVTGFTVNFNFIQEGRRFERVASATEDELDGK